MQVIVTDTGIQVVSDQQVIIEELTLDAINAEMQAIVDAIDDIENFKQRRLDNLNSRMETLQNYLALLVGRSNTSTQV